MNNSLSKPFLTIPDTSDRLQVSDKTVRRWIERGDLIAHKLGTQWRISEVDLDLFLRTRRGANLAEVGGK